MKYVGPNAYKHITDPETGATTLQLDPTSRAIEYSDRELQTWIEKDAVPRELGEFALKQIRETSYEWESWLKFLSENPNATEEEKLEEWSKRRKLPNKDEVQKGFDFLTYLLENHEKLKLALEPAFNPQTFAIPSHPLMFSLLAMFAGKSKKIPRELLEKPYNERTPEEQKHAEQYLNEIFETKKEYDFGEGKEEITENRIALICNNAKVEGKADITWSLFRHDLSFREDRLAIYIKRTFGPEGIRHLLGLIIGLEENFRTGSFEWSVNEHLERLGYRKKTYGSFDPELKKMASEIIRIFTGLCITSTRKDGKKDSLKGKFLFMVEGFEIQTFGKEIIDEKITLVATEFWYKNAFSPSDAKAPKYTKLLKEIVKENHREHPLTLYLTPFFAIFWRINPEKKFKVRALMEWCDLDSDGKYRADSLRDLESTLEYMKQKNYLGEWSNSGEARLPSECLDPYECVLTLTPPEWLKNEFAHIENKRDILQLPQKIKSINHAEFINIFEESGLTRKQFANSLGITPQMVTAMINGKRKITTETSKKVLQFLQERSETNRNKTLPS